MKRRDFLGKIGLAAGCFLAVSPILAKGKEQINTSKYTIGIDPFKGYSDIKKNMMSDKYLTGEIRMLRIVNDNTYRINDVFTDGLREFIVVYSDSGYYYCYPSEGWYNFMT